MSADVSSLTSYYELLLLMANTSLQLMHLFNLRVEKRDTAPVILLMQAAVNSTRGSSIYRKDRREKKLSRFNKCIISVPVLLPKSKKERNGCKLKLSYAFAKPSIKSSAPQEVIYLAQTNK